MNNLITRNINIKNYLDIDINLSASYTCDGYYVGEQLKEHGPYLIEYWNLVKQVEYFVTADNFDDLVTIKLNKEKIYESEHTGDYSLKASGTVPFKMKSNKLIIELGANNLYPSKCYVTNLKVKLKLKFS